MQNFLKNSPGRIGSRTILVITEILHHSQLAFYEQASCLFHKKIYLLWNRPESLLLTMVQYLSYNPLIYCFSTGGKV